MNQKYIAATLCVNKNKPEMHCNGKCYLMKKLKQAQEKEQRQERQSQKTQLQDALIEIPLRFNRYAFAKVKFHIPFSTGIPKAGENSVFHPPQQA
ncbi:hypothetical protein ACXZ1K_12595 [Pedobacter sp. PWIIR3]